MLSGDRNSIEISDLLTIDSSLRQLVDKPTRKDKILDVILTNLAKYYKTPCIIPPIKPDIEGRGAESDHSGVFMAPNCLAVDTKQKITIQVRPISESGLNRFGEQFVTMNWSFLDEFSNPGEMTNAFESTMKSLTDTFLPLKTISISQFDCPYFTEELHSLRRRKQR